VALAWAEWGLVVTGDTFRAKELLKSHGGRWDAARKGWLFETDGKAALLKALRDSPDIGDVKDDALAKLSMEPAEGGKSVAVLGETFPVRQFLKDRGGRWNKSLGAWIFAAELGASIRASLLASPDVGEVKDPRGCCAKAAGGSGGSGAALPIADAPRRQQAATPQRALVAVPSKGVKATSPKSSQGTLATPPKGAKVETTAKETRTLKRGADGSCKAVVTQEKRRRITGKQGEDIMTESVTRQRQVRETEHEIEEISTITVKRVRRKSAAR